MRADPAWQAARSIPRSQKQARNAAFALLRKQYHFSEFALHDFAKTANCAWIADHIDAMMAQVLATRAYQAVNRMCLGKAKQVRFKSQGRGLDSVENKKPLSQRWHQCACGIGPIQRDLYSAFLAAHLDPANPIPSIAHDQWERAELRVQAAV
jgi:hypothetical protein